MAEDFPSPTLLVGSLLAGRYRVGAMLGAGGMATVHRAHDEILGRDVAIKLLRTADADATARRRERAEVDMLASLSHRALVTVFDAATVHLAQGAGTVIVMELVDGPTLARRRRRGPIADVDLARLAVDLAEALVVVHARGIVHRDVKPSNILLAPSPSRGREFDARLADFGIATLEGGARLTATGTVLGTAAYLSPEQAMGGAVTAAADVYSFGLVLLEAITGEREFPGPVLEALSARMLRDPVIPASIHPRWATLLAAMTAREVADRPSPEEVLEVAAGLLADRVPAIVEPPTATMPIAVQTASDVRHADLAQRAAPPGDRALRRRRPILVALTTAAAVMAGVVAAVVASQATTGTPAPAEVAEVSDAPAAPAVASDAPTPTPSEEPVVAPVVDPAPADDPASGGTAGVAPAVDLSSEDGGNGNGNGGNGNGGSGNAGNGNGSGPSGNSGNGSGSGGNSGNGNGNR
ncbi:serine/threonine-protein kinase [Agrococcus sp. SGAir0287]|uniref:serine/threonine-protein kinase n=1 Tax=Agrococcus sp. SGAir0287 TaxID=2070347 RepID=UPI0010CCB5F6|nr:serine/threonine-protein kinase [Agrococcus sp. SGAir0287]QCR20478.1 serine/threonine protein kinase [Agrococcus sp. SGAir0287]